MKWQFLDNKLENFALGFPDLEQTAVVMSPIADYRAHLFARESLELSAMAEKRQLGFASGRHCSHLAQKVLGLPPQAIDREDRVPIWPGPSKGSITHSTDIAAAIASTTYGGVGIDIESLGRVEEKLFRMLFTADETAYIAKQDFDAPSVMFSAKEAGYKAVYPIGQQFIGFQEAEIHLDVANHRFSITYLGSHPPNLALNRGFGYWHMHADHVLTIFCIPEGMSGEGDKK